MYSFINISGLALGVACCALILLYTTNEWSFDEFHSKSDRIYRAWTLEDYGEGDIYFNTVTPFVLKPTLEQSIPEVEQIARRYVFNDLVKRSESDESFSTSIQAVDPEFFSIFDFELLRGDSEQLFSGLNEVVLTPELANQYFENEDPLQKTLLIMMGGQFQAFTVTGIIEKAPSNSSIQYELLIPMEKAKTILNPNSLLNWYSVTPETYVLLNEQADLTSVQAKFPAMMEQALGEDYNEGEYEVGLQPITDIHLNTEFPVGIASVSDPTYSYILGAIALLILIIACVNFMTLSISRSTSRAKEVGIRKTIGAERHHLMYQFWGEALLMSVFSVCLGALLSEFLLPYFNQLSGTQLSLQLSADSILLYSGLALFISLIAGIYPALVLSNFKPIEVLKGKLQIKGDKSLFRKGMVVFQFTISIFLIACTLMVNKQLDFLRSKDLGFQKEQVVILQTDLKLGPQMGFSQITQESVRKKELFESQISGNSSVLDLASSIYTPAQQGWIGVDFKDADQQTRRMNINFVDADYLNMMGIKVIEGRSFSDEITSDERRAIIVNQALVDDYGWDNAIGKKLPGSNFEDHEIIGVVENFNYQSLRTVVEPLAMSINPSLLLSGIANIGFFNSPSPRISLKISAENIPETIKNLEQTWSAVSPGTPFDFQFLDSSIDSQYRQEERLQKIAISGSTLAIIIACLGLFGLASLMISRRVKEIGIRKVLGASAASITLLVNKEFTILVLVSILLAIPMAWYAIGAWLDDFAYKADMGFWMYLLAGGIAISISWITISIQSIKAAQVNPVNSLKSE
ncbi:MAG: ABC transporter permease [Balneola sp.]|nr:ABC transporter permease [Balneola sp.]MBO6651788.1 ABC transporter permease [Balneola sp.]